MLTLACQQEVAPEGQTVTITASFEADNDTRTTVVDGGAEVFWEPGDRIKMFHNGESAEFVSLNTEKAKTAQFEGTLDMSALSGSNPLWAIYPADGYYRDDRIDFVFSSTQIGRAGSFAKDTHYAMACSSGTSLKFYSVGGGIRFTLTQNGITRVELTGNNEEGIAGTVGFNFSGGVPKMYMLWNKTTKIILTAPNSQPFQTGVWYYIEALPVTLSSGFTLTFYKNGQQASVTKTKAVSIKRGVYGSLAEVDKGLTFSAPSTTPDAVDLGLPSGTLWASMNLEASSPEETGGLFSWGGIVSRTSFLDFNYEFAISGTDNYSKYVTDADYGEPDYKSHLDPEDDAAHVLLGQNWRIPTYDECKELINECSWTWTTHNGVEGYEVASKTNGNSIFLPLSSGYYTSSAYYSTTSYFLAFSSNAYAISGHYRFYGRNIRPVSAPFVEVQSVRLPTSSVSLNEGDVWSPQTSVYPSNATDPVIGFSSSDNSVVTCGTRNGSYYIKAVKEGNATITAYSSNGKTAICHVTVVKPYIPEPALIDMGLPSGLLWSSFNLGADSPESVGNYYSWGEVGTKNDYSSANYTQYDYGLTYYDDGSGITTDERTVLGPEDDAAHVLLGKSWRMPTIEEFDELLNSANCSISSGSYGGRSGYWVESKANGNRLFLPCGGIKYSTKVENTYIDRFWTSSLSDTKTSDGVPWYAYACGAYYYSPGGTSYSRNYGLPIRPVSPLAIDELYIIGDATDSGWNLNRMEAFANNGGVFTWEGRLAAGFEFRFPLKKASDSWWPCLMISSDGSRMVYGACESDKTVYNVAESGKYRITVDARNPGNITHTITFLGADPDNWDYTPGDEYLAAGNLWKKVDEQKAASFFYHIDPNFAGAVLENYSSNRCPYVDFKQSTYKVTMTNTTSSRWENMLFIYPSVQNCFIGLSSEKRYRFKVTLQSTVTFGMFFKLAKYNASGAPKYEGDAIWERDGYPDNVKLTAGEPVIVETILAGHDCENINLIFDFGGSRKGTIVYIKDITIEEMEDASISVNGVAASPTGGVFKVPSVHLSQGGAFTITGNIGTTGFVPDPDFLTSDGKFAAVDGNYSVELHLDDAGNNVEWARFWRLDSTGANANLEGGGCYIQGNYFSVYKHDVDLGWPGTGALQMAQVRPGVFQVSGYAVYSGDTRPYGRWEVGSMNVKYFYQDSWGGEASNDRQLTERAAALLDATSGDPGNLYLKSGVTLEEGAMYVMTIDFSACTISGNSRTSGQEIIDFYRK